MEENQTETPTEDQDMVDQQHDIDEQSSVSHEFEDNHVSEQNQNQCIDSSSLGSHIVVETIESDLPSSRDGESLTEPKWLQGDESVALWVKWRGKWQAGIRCARADWPLSTLKAKPTHDRKKYFVIFFPHTRNYSWADMLLVRPIHDLPQPIAYRSHKGGLKLVRDLSIARRFIMRKLAIGILNIIDQFHTEAFVESARGVQIWKEYAAEVSRSNGYSDLGKMLLKLQTMIMPHYMNSEWIQQSLESWNQRCRNASTAESVEMLKEELHDSILWREVNSAPIQSPLGSDWKSWKNDVLKWFSTPQPVPTATEIVHQNIGEAMVSDFLVSRKRPKLEIRRAEVHTSPIKTKAPDSAAVEIDSGFFNDSLNRNDPINPNRQSTASPSSVTDRWDDIVVAGGNSAVQSNNSKLTPVRKLESTPASSDSIFFTRTLDSGTKSRQCTAFIESKGRQCVRSANEGDVYCCVHLASRFLGGSARSEKPAPVELPMCGGTTVLGTKCKHRSLPGFTFCKKHRPRDGSADKAADFSESIHRRKHHQHQLFISTPETAKHAVGPDPEEDEDVLHVNPISVVPSNITTSFNESPEPLSREYAGTHCIGLCLENNVQCTESPKRYSLYCDTHLPSWLKRARNGKSRIVSKEVFVELLRGCSSDKQKVYLHQACELFFKLFKSILSLRNPVPMEVQLQWAVSEASKDIHIGEFLMKLVCSEIQRLRRIWGFGGEMNSSAAIDEQTLTPWNDDANPSDDENAIKCNICSEEFLDDEMLGEHWMESHKKEAQWLFQGYACAICLDSYTNKKILESHVQERHHVQFVEQCKLLRCISCSSHFGNTDELWSHVLSVHSAELRLSKARHFLEEYPSQNSASPHINGEALGNERRFICRFCGLKFDLLPDLGRHHQAAHMGPSLMTSKLAKRGLGIRYYAYKLKSGRLSRPKFKKGLGAAASYRIRNRGSSALKKRMQVPKPLSSAISNVQPHLTEPAATRNLDESQCSVIAKVLFSDFKKTKPRPNNREILSVARSGCCKESIRASLEGVYGELPERVYLKAAKLCSEQGIRVNWHLEGFVCPNGCKPAKGTQLLSPLVPPTKDILNLEHSSDPVDDEWEVDEGHCVIDLHQVKPQTLRNAVVLCNDISFGREPVPVVCVVDEWILDALHTESPSATCSMPWKSFTYVEKPMIDQSVGVEVESLQLGCMCSPSTCNPEACDHVYLFDNDYEDAKDIHGRSMRGRFPYDESGRIILEEGYLVYECNHMCSCSRKCPNRVLQNGVRAKLEVFKTEKKGWAVRAGEAISRGTFICEYIGEVLDDLEADNRRIRYGKEGCRYLYEIKPHINDMSRLIEAQVRYIIDSTHYGNVSRFINHSCSPNLVNHQVLVESMDCERAHIGLYASQDISIGEELTYDFRYEQLPAGEEAVACHCGASNCRGRLY